MRIAIDARELCGAPTGVGRYIGSILSAWSRQASASAHEFILCAQDTPALPDVSGLRLSTMTEPGGGTLWEQGVLPRLVRRARADVLLAPGYTGPLLCPVPMVLAIHDVSFAAHPEWFSWREGARRRTVTRLAARCAARILTISEFSRAEICVHLGVEREKIRVIYPGVTRLPVGSIPASPRAPDTNEPQTILFVGSIFNRRHVPELIEAVARLRRTGANVALEIVGDNRTAPHIDIQRIAVESGVSDRIRVRSYVADGELGALYAAARAFVFLSEYEGFGLTPVEALAAGVPVVLLDTPVAREVCGEAAEYTSRPDPADIEAALRLVLFDESERTRQLTAASPLANRYSWDSCALGVLKELEACRTDSTGSSARA